MSALPQILAMVLPLAAFVLLADRATAVAVRRVLLVAVIAGWLYAGFELIVLGQFAISPSGIGVENGLELLVAVGVVLGLPLWLAVTARRRAA